MDECNPLPSVMVLSSPNGLPSAMTQSPTSSVLLSPVGGARGSAWSARGQGLTLVHFSAQLQRFLRDRGCIWGFV